MGIVRENLFFLNSVSTLNIEMNKKDNQERRKRANFSFSTVPTLFSLQLARALDARVWKRKCYYGHDSASPARSRTRSGQHIND